MVCVRSSHICRSWRLAPLFSAEYFSGCSLAAAMFGTDRLLARRLSCSHLRRLLLDCGHAVSLCHGAWDSSFSWSLASFSAKPPPHRFIQRHPDRYQSFGSLSFARLSTGHAKPSNHRVERTATSHCDFDSMGYLGIIRESLSAWSVAVAHSGR